MEKEVDDIFQTIQSDSRGVFKDRGSKFLAFAFPVSSEEEIKIHMHRLKKEYHDARHHCYAYRIGTENMQYRVNDDGEPSGTAGKPIYGQIVSHSLTNILIVVVRYFGGTLLGTSGLINAYRAAAKDSLQHASIIELTVQEEFSLHFNYADLNPIMRIIKEETALILEQHFDSECRLKLSIRKSRITELFNRLGKLEHVEIIKN
jgi:uncharacterized YigZ family protein